MTSFNTGILLKGVALRIILMLNNPFVSCLLINYDFLLPHATHFDNIIVPQFIAFKTSRIIPCVSSPLFKQ